LVQEWFTFQGVKASFEERYASSMFFWASRLAVAARSSAER
jgi:hypothetical protein